MATTAVSFLQVRPYVKRRFIDSVDGDLIVVVSVPVDAHHSATATSPCRNFVRKASEVVGKDSEDFVPSVAN